MATPDVAEDATATRLDTISGGSSLTNQDAATSSLDPVDRGYAAWKLLWSAFVFEALLWGFPLSFGVFQDYYSQIPTFSNNPHVAVVGSVASGLTYLGAPVISPLIRRYPQHRKKMIWFGWSLCISGLIAGSFATTLVTLILTQGVMYGVGFVIFEFPIISMVDEFWIGRRGMAYGMICSSSGVSGTVMPLVIRTLLQRYGYQITLRAVAVALFILTGPLIPGIKGRLPVSEHGGSFGRTDWSWLRQPLFWTYTISNILYGFGYFFPSLFLPSYATAIGLSSLQGAGLLAVMSIAQVLGQLGFGYLSDRRVPLDALITMSLLVSALSTFTLWGLARSFAPLLVFAMLFGLFGAGYTAMWARMVSAVSEEQSAALAMFSTFNFGKGVGNVLVGPISGVLIVDAVRVGSYGIEEYKAVVVFTGVSMLLSAASLGMWYVQPKRLISVVLSIYWTP